MSVAYRFTMSGLEQVPSVTTSAAGIGWAIYDSTLSTLQFEINFTGLDWGNYLGFTPSTVGTSDDVNGAHFHTGARGANGGVVFDWDLDDDLTYTIETNSSVTVKGLWETTDANSIASFLATLAGGTVASDISLYANVHTVANSSGEVRGQFVGLATDGNDAAINGTSGNDYLPGLSGDDTLNGLQGNDTLEGGLGIDAHNGGDGNDTIKVWQGDLENNETIDGGNNTDTLLTGGVAFLAGATLSSIEIVDMRHPLAGSGNTVVINGSQFGSGIAANATLISENTFDTLQIGSIAGNLDVGTLQLGAWNGIVNLVGGGAAQQLSGTEKVDSINALFGNDTVEGRGGNDTLNGGTDTDTAVYGDPRSDYRVWTVNEGGELVTIVKTHAGTEGTDRIKNFEILRFDVDNFQFAGANLNLRANVVDSSYDDVVFHNDSTGQSFAHIFDSGARIGSGPLTAALGAQWDAIDSADMNSDGIADIIYKNTIDGSIQIGTSSASGVTGFTTLTTSLSTTWRLVGAADVDGDAYTDLIIQNNATGFIYSADFTDLAFNQYKPVSGEGTIWQARALGDVNRDGNADIIYQNTANGDVVAGLMTASSTISSYLSIAAVGNWTVKEAADMNRDGYLDILIQNNANGDISYANMAGGTFSGYGTVMNGFGTAWQLEGMADTNNDGDVDAVIRNVLGSGDTYVVNMEGGAFQSFTLVAQGIGSQWYVV